MKFTAQEEYGLRCMVQFARRELSPERSRSLTIGEIAEIEGLTPQYAGKLIRVLRMGGLLQSVRGRHGGYRLARPLDAVSVGEVLAVLGGRVFEPNYCSRYTGERKFCVHTVDCAIRSLWKALQGAMDAVLSNVKLRDLVASERSVAEFLGPVVRELGAVREAGGPSSSGRNVRPAPPGGKGNSQPDQPALIQLTDLEREA